MNLRRIAKAIYQCVEGTPARVQVYRIMVAEVAEPSALEHLWGIDRHLDREIVQWCRDHVPDPLALSPSTSTVFVFDPHDDRSCNVAMEATP